MFSISYTPIEYGKEKEGKLLIYTDEMLWSYMIKGTFPLYEKPDMDKMKGKISDKLSYKALEMRKTRRSQKINYLIKNLQNTGIKRVTQSTNFSGKKKSLFKEGTKG